MQTNNKDSKVSYTRGEWQITVGSYPNSYFLQAIVEDDEADANAKLMAAAPELLEALKELLAQFEKVVDPKYTLDNWLIRDARNAIKKATEQ